MNFNFLSRGLSFGKEEIKLIEKISLVDCAVHAYFLGSTSPTVPVFLALFLYFLS
jgi:hypothetical protein